MFLKSLLQRTLRTLDSSIEKPTGRWHDRSLKRLHAMGALYIWHDKSPFSLSYSSCNWKGYFECLKSLDSFNDTFVSEINSSTKAALRYDWTPHIVINLQERLYLQSNHLIRLCTIINNSWKKFGRVFLVFGASTFIIWYHNSIHIYWTKYHMTSTYNSTIVHSSNGNVKHCPNSP
jgi:hypothetical protein